MTIHGYSLTDARRFQMAIVGQSPVLDAFGRLLALEDFAAAFPRAKLAGWVPTPGALPDPAGFAPPAFLRGQKLFKDIAELFAMRPGLHLVIDVTGDSRHMADIRSHAPMNVSLCTSEALTRFCSATDDGRLAIGGGENLRKAHTLMALVVDQFDGDIIFLDSQGFIQDVNRHAAESRGVPRAQLIGMHCADLAIGNSTCCSTDSGCCPFSEARHTGKISRLTFTRVGQDGRMHYVTAVCTPVLDGKGAPAMYLFSQRDVTEQQHIEQRLQQAEKMAAIGELSTYMAHEIRNPVFSIGGFANALLRNPSLNELAREKARIIYDESRRLDEILANILNFARPTAQNIGEFDAGRVARQTLDLMALGSEGRGLTITMDVEANLPKAVGNAENLKQSLINVLKNAFEAMPDGGALGMHVRRDKEFIRIDVSDSGKGIPLDIQEQIFSPFFTTKHGGAGLGLAMTRKVIEEMGGQVTLESAQGRGTTVTLRIPVALALEANRLSGTPEIPTSP